MKGLILSLALAGFTGLRNSDIYPAAEAAESSGKPSILAAKIDGSPIRKYKTSKILDRLNRPPTKGAEIGDIPSHLQYVTSLDQAGIMSPGTGTLMVDPEAAVTFSSGDFWVEKRWGRTRAVKQRLNRCAGGGWSYYYNDIVEIGEGKTVIDTGKEFFSRLRSNEEEKFCYLTFTWNDDFTYATISGYMEERMQYLPYIFAAPIVSFFGLSIKLMPYWAWKFGISTDDAKKAESLDDKCCPPKNNTHSCKGPGKLGNPKSKCETISTACGVVKPENSKTCALWRRDNKAFGSIPFPDFTGVGSYYVYPIGDKNGKPTSFKSRFVDGLEKSGVSHVFHGTGSYPSHPAPPIEDACAGLNILGKCFVDPWPTTTYEEILENILLPINFIVLLGWIPIVLYPTKMFPQKTVLAPVLILCILYSGLHFIGGVTRVPDASNLRLIAESLGRLDKALASWYHFSIANLLIANAVALDFHSNFQAKASIRIIMMGVFLMCFLSGPMGLLLYFILRQSMFKKYSLYKPKEYCQKTRYEHLQDIYRDKIPTPSLIERFIPAKFRPFAYTLSGICGISLLVFLLFVVYPAYVLLCLVWWNLTLRGLSEGFRRVSPGEKWPIKAVVVVGGHWRLFLIVNKRNIVLRTAFVWLPYVLEFAFFVEFFAVIKNSRAYCEALVQEFGPQFPFNKGIGFSTHAEVQKRLEDPETTKAQLCLAFKNSDEQYMFSSRTTLFYPQNNGQRFIVTEGRRIAKEFIKDAHIKIKDPKTEEFLKAMLPKPNDDGSMLDVVHIKRAFVATLFHLITGGEFTRDELAMVDGLEGNVFPFLPSWINFLGFGGRKKREGMDDLKHFRDALLRYPDAEALQNALKLAKSLGWEHGETVRFLTYIFCIAGAFVPPRLSALVLERIYRRPLKYKALYKQNEIKFIKEEARLANNVPILTSTNHDPGMVVEINRQPRHIPLGTPFHCSMPLANRDASVFGPEGDEFDAERPTDQLYQMLVWNGTESKICEGNTDFASSENNPPRRCVGHDLSLLITKFVVDLYLPPDEAHNPSCGDGQRLYGHQRHCVADELISKERFKDVLERELSFFNRELLEAGRKVKVGWNDNYPLAADALYPGDAEQKHLGTLLTATGDTAITYDEDDPPDPLFPIMKLALTKGAPVQDASGEWRSREEAIGWRIKYFGSSYPPALVKYDREGLSEEQQLEQFAFAGLPCFRTKRISTYNEEHMVSKKHPANAEFVNESLALGDCRVRPGYQRYGAAAFFDENCKILGIYTCFNGKLVTHGASERGQNHSEWRHAVWVWKTSALALGTIVDHLGKTHLIESNALVSASRKHLPPTHPLRAFLKIFTYRTVSINVTAFETLTVKKGLVERIWALEGDVIQEIFKGLKRNYKFVTLCDNIDNSMKDLGDDKFPANKDAKEFWDITREFVHEVLKTIYKEGPLRMEDDEALQCFLQEMNDRLKLDESNYKVTEFDDVVDVLASLICTATAYHEHVGHVSDYFGDPTFAGATLREGKEIDTIQTHCMLSSLVAATGLRVPRLLDNWEHVLQRDVYSTKNVRSLQRFHSKLVTLSQDIEMRNTGAGDTIRRRFVLKSFNPMNLESSVSV